MATAQERMSDMLGSTFGVFNFSSVGSVMKWILFSILIAVLIAGGIGWWYYNRKYKHLIVVWGKIGNEVKIKWQSKAREFPIGQVGDMLFFLRQKKRLIPCPTLQVAPNIWYYWEREDGELINITLEDLDEKQRRMGIKFIDSDMRMQRLGIEKNLQFRLQKGTFWEKYGQMIVNIVFYVLVTMMIIIIFTQLTKVSQSLNTAVETAGQVLEKVQGVKGGTPLPQEILPSGSSPTISTS